MAVSGNWVKYGREAASALRSEITDAKGAEPLAPVTVVVASNQAGVSVRRLLASGALGAACGAGPGLIGVDFVTPYRLAELLGAARLAGQEKRPVSTPVIAAAVRGVLADRPGLFLPVVAHPATESALVASYRELRELTDCDLEALADRGRRAAEVVRVYRSTRQRLAPDWSDEQDLMASAALVIAESGADPGLGTVIVYLPQRLTRHGAELLRAIGARTRLHVLAGAVGDGRADAEVAHSVGSLSAAIGDPPSTSALHSSASPDRTSIITSSDAEDEVRSAGREVSDAARAGTSLDRIALLHASVEPYGRIIHDHLSSAGIPMNGAAEVALAGRLASRSLLGLLALPATGYRRQDIFAWLTAAPVRHRGLRVPTSAWDRISRSAGIVAGRPHWDERLGQFATGLDAEADQVEADPGRQEWIAERDRAEAQRARDLRTFVLGLIDRLAEAAGRPRSWAEHARWARDLAAETFGGPGTRSHWPDVERRAADRLDLALDRLAALDDVEGRIGLDVFTRTLTTELESDLGRVGRFGEGVLVGPVSMGVGVDLDLVILVGMAEGTFPAVLRDDSLLPDEDREATNGALALRSQHVDRLHHHFLATMSGAATQILCVPRGDLRRSRERVPSRWVLDVASELAGCRQRSTDLTPPTAVWVRHLASFDDGLRRAGSPATAQEHRLRRLMAAPADARLVRVVGDIDATLAAGVDLIEHRERGALSRFDGNLAGQEIPSPIERGTSATRLEAWAKCPYAYLMQYVLGIEPVEQPEDALTISPLDQGNLVHQALETFITEVLEADRAIDPTEPWSEADHVRLARISTELCADFERRGLTGRLIFWRRDRSKILADLDRFLHSDDAHRRTTHTRPAAAELAFGYHGAAPLGFPLDDGRTLPLRGKADRVDLAGDGTIHVVDYKTGSSKHYKGLDQDDPHQGGRRLQLGVYGRAARQQLGRPDAPVRAEYWFTSSKGGFGREGYDVTDEVMAEVGRAIETIVTGIENGLFPPHPKPPDTSPFIDCHYCDPDGLGTGELTRHWESKAQDPALGPYLGLVEPEEDEAPVPGATT